MKIMIPPVFREFQFGGTDAARAVDRRTNRVGCTHPIFKNTAELTCNTDAVAELMAWKSTSLCVMWGASGRVRTDRTFVALNEFLRLETAPRYCRRKSLYAEQIAAWREV